MDTDTSRNQQNSLYYDIQLLIQRCRGRTRVDGTLHTDYRTATPENGFVILDYGRTAGLPVKHEHPPSSSTL